VYDDFNDLGTSELARNFHPREKSTKKKLPKARNVERSMT